MSSIETRSTTAQAPGLTVVIANYNYADFVGQAIESALGIDWPLVQVVVVDDGSTDTSRAVIEAYRGRVEIVHQSNSGQAVAYNVGFSRALHDVVIFLDSDDMLEPSVMRRIAEVWRPGISKVQFRMQTVDAAGRASGHCIPQFHGTPTPEQIRHWAATTTAYPTPPGSGNAYAKAYLAQILPLDDSWGRIGDSCCLCAAPFLGDVVTLDIALCRYRVHGRNDGAMSQLNARQFQQHVTGALQRHRFAQQAAKRVGIEVPDHALDRSLRYLPYRLASLRLAPATHPIAGDSTLKVLADVLRALPMAQGMSFTSKLAIALWTCGVAMLPRAAGDRLILWRFVPAARPQTLRVTLNKLGVIR